MTQCSTGKNNRYSRDGWMDVVGGGGGGGGNTELGR